MASGKTHDFATYLALPLVFGGAYWLTHGSLHLSALATAGVWFGGIFLSPDLDTRSRPFYRWGLFRFIWWPYQWMAKHRSALSHGLVFAPLFRLVYLSALLILLYTSFSWFSETGYLTPQHFWTPRPETWTWIQRHRTDLLWFCGGAWGGSLLHILLDLLSSLRLLKL